MLRSRTQCLTKSLTRAWQEPVLSAPRPPHICAVRTMHAEALIVPSLCFERCAKDAKLRE